MLISVQCAFEHNWARRSFLFVWISDVLSEGDKIARDGTRKVGPDLTIRVIGLRPSDCQRTNQTPTNHMVRSHIRTSCECELGASKCESRTTLLMEELLDGPHESPVADHMPIVRLWTCEHVHQTLI